MNKNLLDAHDHYADAALYACMIDCTDTLSLYRYINRHVEMFSVSDSSMTGLIHACIRGHVAIVNLLLHADGVTNEWVDKVEGSSKTALTHAVKNNHIDCIAALISFGANVNAVDSAGMSVLHQMVMKY
jgi:ankyrin repeat protein